jgi:hypothetical protein
VAPANVKPLVPTTIRTEFGDVLESDAFHSATGAQGDFTYVPGYSELRRARDLAQREINEGKRDAKDMPPALPVRLQWVRTARVSNTPDNRKSVEFGNQGYRCVTKADLGTPWFKAMPDGAIEEAGGEIRQGDCTLMVVDAPRAARNAAAIHLRTTQLMGDAAASQLLQLGASKPGTDPSFDVKQGEQITVGSSIRQK